MEGKKKKGELSVFSMVGSNTLQLDSLQKRTLNKCHGMFKPAKKAGQIQVCTYYTFIASIRLLYLLYYDNTFRNVCHVHVMCSSAITRP